MLWHSRPRDMHQQLTISRQEVEERVLSALAGKLMRKDFFEDSAASSRRRRIGFAWTNGQAERCEARARTGEGRHSEGH